MVSQTTDADTISFSKVLASTVIFIVSTRSQFYILKIRDTIRKYYWKEIGCSVTNPNDKNLCSYWREEKCRIFFYIHMQKYFFPIF